MQMRSVIAPCVKIAMPPGSDSEEGWGQPPGHQLTMVDVVIGLGVAASIRLPLLWLHRRHQILRLSRVSGPL